MTTSPERLDTYPGAETSHRKCTSRRPRVDAVREKRLHEARASHTNFKFGTQMSLTSTADWTAAPMRRGSPRPGCHCGKIQGDQLPSSGSLSCPVRALGEGDGPVIGADGDTARCPSQPDANHARQRIQQDACRIALSWSRILCRHFRLPSMGIL